LSTVLRVFIKSLNEFIVKYVRFEGWQNSTLGEREVKRELRKIIWVKYQIKDEDLFNRAYDYSREYY